MIDQPGISAVAGHRLKRTDDEIDGPRRRRRLPRQLIKRLQVVLAVRKRPGQGHPPGSRDCSGVVALDKVPDELRASHVGRRRDELGDLRRDVLIRREKVASLGVDDSHASRR